MKATYLPWALLLALAFASLTEGMKEEGGNKGDIGGNTIKREWSKNEEESTTGTTEEEEEEVAWIWIIPPKQQTSTTTRAKQVERVQGAVTNLTLEIRTHTHTLTLDVYANRELLGHTYRAAGVTENQGWCEYQGAVRGEPSSLVAVSICGGLTGAIYTGGQWVEVLPHSQTHTLAGPHLLRHPSLRHPHGPIGMCGVKGDNNKSKEHQQQEQSDILDRVSRSLRGDYLWTQRNTSFVEVVVVVDKALKKDLSASASSPSSAKKIITNRVQGIMNMVNAIYKPLGIITVLTHIEVWDSDKTEVVDKDSNATLKNFKTYLATFRSENPGVPVDNIQLLTGVSFEGNTVGKGAVGGMCGPSSVGVSMDGAGRGVLGTAQVMVHEMGHNFGLNHVDEVEGCDCVEKNCIMLSSGMGNAWDECSRKNISQLLPSLALECLRNRPPSAPLSSCGDGVVEDEEECDCGPSCPHSCCDPQTCRLVGNATCGSGPCCDFETCHPLPSWPPVECRPAHNPCDVTEICNGWNEDCPADSWVQDGTACEVGKGFCYQGECGSAWGRCEQVWGAGATPCTPSEAKINNVIGKNTGNCGYENEETEELKACEEEDAECGTLLCRTPEETDNLGHFFHRTQWQGPKTCRVVSASTAYPSKAWLAPDGAYCGDGKMCIGQRCVTRPTPLSTIIFWIVVVISALLLFLCWDHLRYCWERKGWGSCCHTHLPYCASCLDACCCPCMNRINRLILAVLPPLRCPKCPFTLRSPASGDREGKAAGNGEVVCNGGIPGEPGENVRPPGEARGGRETGENADDWGVENIVKFAPKGVTFKPISPLSASRPRSHTPHTEVPLLAPLHDAPQPPPPNGTPGILEFVNDSQSGNFSDSQMQDHGSLVPVRPAPLPPTAHMDTHTDAHTHRPTPSVPPRPVLTHPLRPSLPPSPPPPHLPPLGSFPSSPPHPHPLSSSSPPSKPPLPPKP